MAKLSLYFGNHSEVLKIYVGFFEVGSGTFSVLNDSEVDFAGSYHAFGQAGNFTIGIQLTEDNSAAVSGLCEVTLNGSIDASARYEVHGAKLTIVTTLNRTLVAIYRNQNGTQIDGVSGHNLWIG
ncbi:hypothetical protein ACVWWI_006316 [Bradyrhizobium sp. USDA 3686]|uniref:hypothetical protein n=1 Tax=Bradyrhizobium canariense TaxID=255045 RepID=UPI00195E2D8B|nr:hypothetical protein [Bradyrhizobium canariense]MBM7488133.1 hypothetical protein [Bradyrhizobium canariense]